MKCFIHPNKESVATCTKCGKAMCVDCSSFSAHSGVCPACKKAEMDKEVLSHKKEIRKRERRQKLRLTLTVLFFFLIIPIFLYKKYKLKNQREIAKIEEKIDNINKSLRFVNEALERGSGDLSVDSKTSLEFASDNSGDAWQCPFCRTINKGGKACKFCARKKPQ